MPGVQPLPPFPISPGEWLHRFRYRLTKAEQERWTREDLGAELGVSGRTVARWETGQSEPTQSDLENLAACLHLSVLQAEFLFRAFGPKRIERAPEAHVMFSRVRDLVATGFPVLILDSLYYVRALSTYNQILATSDTTSAGQPGVDHMLWQILASDRTPESREHSMWWIKTIWLETASLCGTPAYERMISRLRVAPGFEEAWLRLADLNEGDSVMEDGPADIVLPSGVFREFRIQLFLPPVYHVRQFVPMDDRAKQSLSSLRNVGAPGATFSRLLHWSEEERLSSIPSRRGGRSMEPNEAVQVILFSKEFDCAPCMEAKRFLQANHVAYVEKDVSERENLVQLARDYRILRVPVLVVNNEPIEGFNREEYERALGL